MPQHEGETPLYGERYVAFLDVLGFKALVEEADRHRDQISTILTSLLAFREILERYGASEVRYSQFSDSVIISAPRTEAGMTYLFEACVRISTRLLKEGVLVRGGIVRGNVMHTEQVAFGPAIAEAYQADGSGSPPRILLSNDVIEDGVQSRLLVDKWPGIFVQDDYDGQFMLNIVLFAATARKDASAILDLDMGSSIAKRIRESCNPERNHPNVVAKWRWFRRYWNDAVDENGYLPRA